LQGNANDYSSYNNNGIIYNAIFVPINVTQVSNLNVSSSPIINQFPVVGKFNGVNSYIGVSNLIPLNLGTGDFTLVAWIKAQTIQVTYPQILSKRSSTSDGFLFGLWSDGRLFMQIAGTNYPPATDPNLKDNRWHLVVATRKASNVTYYIDGMGKGSFTSTANMSSSHALWIGRDGPASTTTPFNGSIANVQIYSTALTPQQIQQLYLQGINSPPIPNAGLVGWWPLQGNANDYSSYGNNGTAYNVYFVRSNYSYLPVYQSSNKSGASFNGQNSYIYNNAPNNLPTGTVLTITAWVNPSPVQGSNCGAYCGVVSFGNRTCTGYGRLLSLNNVGGGIFYVSMATWCNDYVPNPGPVVRAGQWNFIAMVLNGRSVTLYANQQSSTGTLPSLPNPVGSKNLAIGSTDYFGRLLNGSIANVQIYSTALTPQQIQQLYYAGIPPSNEIRIVLK
jgi:hypothetical protein